MTAGRSRHAGVEQLRDVISREMLWAQLHTKDGPGGAANTVLPALTPDPPSKQNSGASVSMPFNPGPWTDEVRRQAIVAVRIATVRRVASERTFVYFLRAALAHGLSVIDVAQAAGLPEHEILRLADPAAA